MHPRAGVLSVTYVSYFVVEFSKDISEANVSSLIPRILLRCRRWDLVGT